MSNHVNSIEYLFHLGNSTAGDATQSWLTGKGLAAETDSLRWAVDGPPIPAPGLKVALEGLSRSCSEACNRSDSLHVLGRGEVDDTVLAAAQATSDALEEAAEETGVWMRRLAQLSLGVSVHLAASDASAMAERAAVIAIVTSGYTLVDDGLWVASTSMIEFAPELAGWLCRICVEHDCRLTFTDASDPTKFSIEIVVDSVGNLALSCSFADEALLARAERRGWTIEGDRLVSHWVDPFHPTEVAGLLIDTMVGEGEVASPMDLTMVIETTI